MLTYITLDSSFVTSTLDVAGDLVTDLSTYLSLMIGVFLTLAITTILMKALRH